MAFSGNLHAEKTIALVLFPELTLLDLVGPLQVLKGLPESYVETLTEPVRTKVLQRRKGLPSRAGKRPSRARH